MSGLPMYGEPSGGGAPLLVSEATLYGGTSLIRNQSPVGPYSSIRLGPYGGPRGGCCFL